MKNASTGSERALLVSCLVLMSACTGAALQADRYFSRGDYPHAAASYEASMAAAGQTPLAARSLYRLAIARATPGTEAFDPAKAAAAFEELLKRYPASEYAREAALPSALVRELNASSAKLGDLLRDRDQAKAQLDALARSSQEDGRILRQELEDRKAQVVQLRARVAEQEQAVARLKVQIEQIKRIDLSGSPK